jgi:ankyrin repeat protein
MTSEDEHSHGCGCGQHSYAVASVHQSVEELDFTRGLWQAAIDGDVPRLTKLLSKRSANEVDASGLTALHYASRCGHTEIVRSLLHHGAAVDCVSRGNLTPLMLAASQGHREVVMVLLEAGVLEIVFACH